jgi:hypothetical protein
MQSSTHDFFCVSVLYSGEYDVWASIPKVVGSIPTVTGHIFQACRFGYTLRVTSQAPYSPEYITPTKKKS